MTMCANRVHGGHWYISPQQLLINTLDVHNVDVMTHNVYDTCQAHMNCSTKQSDNDSSRLLHTSIKKSPETHNILCFEQVKQTFMDMLNEKNNNAQSVDHRLSCSQIMISIGRHMHEQCNWTHTHQAALDHYQDALFLQLETWAQNYLQPFTTCIDTLIKNIASFDITWSVEHVLHALFYCRRQKSTKSRTNPCANNPFHSHESNVSNSYIDATSKSYDDTIQNVSDEFQHDQMRLMDTLTRSHHIQFLEQAFDTHYHDVDTLLSASQHFFKNHNPHHIHQSLYNYFVQNKSSRTITPRYSNQNTTNAQNNGDSATDMIHVHSHGNYLLFLLLNWYVYDSHLLNNINLYHTTPHAIIQMQFECANLNFHNGNASIHPSTMELISLDRVHDNNDNVVMITDDQLCFYKTIYYIVFNDLKTMIHGQDASRTQTHSTNSSVYADPNHASHASHQRRIQGTDSLTHQLIHQLYQWMSSWQSKDIGNNIQHDTQSMFQDMSVESIELNVCRIKYLLWINKLKTLLHYIDLRNTLYKCILTHGVNVYTFAHVKLINQMFNDVEWSNLITKHYYEHAFHHMQIVRKKYYTLPYNQMMIKKLKLLETHALWKTNDILPTQNTFSDNEQYDVQHNNQQWMKVWFYVALCISLALPTSFIATHLTQLNNPVCFFYFNDQVTNIAHMFRILTLFTFIQYIYLSILDNNITL